VRLENVLISYEAVGGFLKLIIFLRFMLSIYLMQNSDFAAGKH
jgi:hypothetical protein